MLAAGPNSMRCWFLALRRGPKKDGRAGWEVRLDQVGLLRGAARWRPCPPATRWSPCTAVSPAQEETCMSLQGKTFMSEFAGLGIAGSRSCCHPNMPAGAQRRAHPARGIHMCCLFTSWQRATVGSVWCKLHSRGTPKPRRPGASAPTSTAPRPGSAAPGHLAAPPRGSVRPAGTTPRRWRCTTARARTRCGRSRCRTAAAVGVSGRWQGARASRRGGAHAAPRLAPQAAFSVRPLRQPLRGRAHLRDGALPDVVGDVGQGATEDAQALPPVRCEPEPRRGKGGRVSAARGGWTSVARADHGMHQQ